MGNNKIAGINRTVGSGRRAIGNSRIAVIIVLYIVGKMAQVGGGH